LQGNARSLVLMSCLVLGAAACARPTGDIDLAKSIFDKAVEGGADHFAVESMKAARQAQSALNAELRIQDAKWFKSYGKARDLAITAQATADKASTEAIVGKKRVMDEATVATDSSRNGPNLFQNGDFADGMNGWSANPESDATVSIDPAGPGEHVWHVKYRKGNWAVLAQALRVRPDTVYVYEATVKSTAPVVALYWQTEIGRSFETDKTYPEWTHLRYVFMTPHWIGLSYNATFNPVLMQGAGEAWIKALRLSQFGAGNFPPHP
jgi:hypothetical protein